MEIQTTFTEVALTMLENNVTKSQIDSIFSSFKILISVLKTIYHSLCMERHAETRGFKFIFVFCFFCFVFFFHESLLRLFHDPRDSSLISVVVGLVRSELRDAQVIGLVLGESSDLDAEMLQMSFGDLLVELLGEHVDADLVFGVTGPEFDLGEDLIGEGIAHDE